MLELQQFLAQLDAEAGEGYELQHIQPRGPYPAPDSRVFDSTIAASPCPDSSVIAAPDSLDVSVAQHLHTTLLFCAQRRMLSAAPSPHLKQMFGPSLLCKAATIDTDKVRHHTAYFQ